MNAVDYVALLVVPLVALWLWRSCIWLEREAERDMRERLLARQLARFEFELALREELHRVTSQGWEPFGTDLEVVRLDVHDGFPAEDALVTYAEIESLPEVGR